MYFCYFDKFLQLGKIPLFKAYFHIESSTTAITATITRVTNTQLQAVADAAANAVVENVLIRLRNLSTSDDAST